MGEGAEDLAGDGDEDEVLLFSLVSGLVFFLGDDLLKRPISVSVNK